MRNDQEEIAEMSLGMDFRDLSRDQQAVLAHASLMSLLGLRGSALISDVAYGLNLAHETVQAIVDELHALGHAWSFAGPDGVEVETTVAMALHHVAPGAGGRPNPKNWAKLREEVFSRQFADREAHCLYCHTTGVELVLDHIVAVSLGGSNHPNNLAPACVPCNSSKRNMTYREWMEYRASRRA